MSFTAFLEKSRSLVASRWADAANAVYPFATAGFLRTQMDPFANPVGQRSRDLSEILYSAVTGLPHDSRALRTALEEFVRVRAIQDVPAETSLAVMYAYKHLVREYIVERNIAPDGLSDEQERLLHAMDERCDTLALLAFGIYARSREALFTARLDDMRRRNSQLMRLAKKHGFALEDETPGPDDGGECVRQ